GRRLYVALNLGADASMTLLEAHAVAERARQEILAHVAGAASVDIHVDPVGLPEGVDPHAWLHKDHHQDGRDEVDQHTHADEGGRGEPAYQHEHEDEHEHEVG